MLNKGLTFSLKKLPGAKDISKYSAKVKSKQLINFSPEGTSRRFRMSLVIVLAT